MTSHRPSEAVEEIATMARQKKRNVLLEPEAKLICHVYNLPVPKFEVATDKTHAVRIARKVGYPVVLKIVSSDIMHKTEAGGVLIDVNSDTEVESGYDRIISHAKAYSRDARLEGVLVQHMAPRGLEVIVGGFRDKQFGPVVMFGLGGIFTEVLRDVMFGITPLSIEEAQEMIRGIRGYPVLIGFRGQSPADEKALAELICGVSNIMDENPMISQLDLNPVMAYEHGSCIVDARMILD